MSDEEKNIQEEEIVETPETTEEEVVETPVEETEPVVEEEPAQEEEVAQESAEAPKKKNRKKKRWKDMTPEEKKKRRIRDIIISSVVIGVVILFIASLAIAGLGVAMPAHYKLIENLEPARGADNPAPVPVKDPDTGYWTFTVENNQTFKVLQLTDIHIGGGAFSINNDTWAINAVAKIVQNVKPDLVIVTGDIGFPVPYSAGTFDNKREAELFATLMEKLGIYWAHVYGNHDTELYSLYDRQELTDLVYMDKEKYPHCLFQPGPTEVDGVGNYIINVKNQLGLITQSFVLFDSHAYTDGDYLGIAWKYDNIHQNQVDWYEKEIKALNTKNKMKYASLSVADKLAYATAIGADPVATEATFTSTDSMTIKSSAYFHIPLVEYYDVYHEYIDSGNVKSGKDYEYLRGNAGESGKVVYCGMHEDNLFETMQALRSTTNIFCGHDHYNNFQIKYWGKDGNKATDFGITLTYGMSIDYLAMPGIAKKYEQRGGTIIRVLPSGDIDLENSQIRLIDIA